MSEMMHAKLAAVKKLKKLMQKKMMSEKHESPSSDKVEEIKKRVDVGDAMDMQNEKDHVKEEEIMKPRRSGKTRSIVMNVTSYKPKFMKK